MCVFNNNSCRDPQTDPNSFLPTQPGWTWILWSFLFLPNLTGSTWKNRKKPIF
jgi:hypothetical protein